MYAATPAQAIALLVLIMVLTGCTTRPTSAVLEPIASPARIARTETLLVATNRAPATANSNDFTNARAQYLSFAEFKISIPPRHVAGQIEWPDGSSVDPKKSFATTFNASLDSEGFRRNVSKALKGASDGGGDVIVFVHGYNYNFQEALFRFAQIAADAREIGVPILFSWPSEASRLGYFADRESAVYSRDDLERTLNELAAVPGVRTIHIVSHSLGAWLVTETLRQAKMRGRSPFLGKLGDVILAAPDIDVDVFRTQLDAIGTLKRPLTILVGRNDKMLKLSQRVAGGRARVGMSPSDVPAAEALAKAHHLRIIDISEMPGPRNNHENYISSIQPLLDMALLSGGSNADMRSGYFLMVAAR